MKHLTSSQLDVAFVRAEVPTFADAIKMVQEDLALSQTRRRDLVSGLRRVAKVLGRPVADVPADPRWLQPRLAKINPASHALTKKAWQNALSDARAAMTHQGILGPRKNDIGQLTPGWREVWANVLELEDRYVRTSLSRFVYFLNRMGIEPDRVDEHAAITYREALTQSEIRKSPEQAYRAAVCGWNRAVRLVPGWPERLIRLPSRQRRVSLPIDTFPASFAHSLDDLIRRLAADDLLTSQAKALRPSSLFQYRRLLVRFASEVVHSGIHADELRGLSSVLRPDIVERGLRQMLAAKGNRTCEMISQTGLLLRNVGRLLGIPAEDQKVLTTLASRVAVKRKSEMTSKNRSRLRILQDAQKQDELLLLPERLFKIAERKGKEFSQALMREDAVAIAILLVCPIRVKNLSEIHLERNVRRPGDGRVFLVFDKEETKTSRPIEFEIPPDVLRLLNRHLASRCPSLCQRGTPWLFPRRDGDGPVLSGQLSARLSRRIRNETGIEMNAHLFRHFAVMLWLDANPGAYEAARRLLGHSAVSHTINMYSGLEVSTAIRAFSDLVATKKKRRA